MPKRYRKLRGDTAYYPFAARTGLRARQRRHVRVLRGAGLAALALAAVLLVRQTVFRGGQPDAPAAVPTAPAVTALPAWLHTIFCLRLVDAVSYAELCRQFQISPENARQRIQQARRRLRSHLVDYT